ncbi:hypothetical protein FRB98_001372 [Tulasnella sp. 332]|nr:hypothetical protein FRB98_001372 [Tulasnella sp. 332]
MTSIQSALHAPLASFSFGLPQPPERPTKRYREDEDDDDDDDLHPRGTYTDYLKQQSAQSLPSSSSQIMDALDGHATGEDEIGLEDEANLDCEDGEDPFTALRSQALNPDGTPKRPMNAFMIFAKRRRPQVAADNASMRTGEISKILSKEWNSMDKNDKQFYNDHAKKLKEDFHKRWPDYVYRRRPNNSRKKRKGSDASMGGDGYSEDLTASSYPLTAVRPDEDVKPFMRHSPNHSHPSSHRTSYEELRRSASNSPSRRRSSHVHTDSVQLSPSHHVHPHSQSSYSQHNVGPLDHYNGSPTIRTPPMNGQYGQQQRHPSYGQQQYGSPYSPARATSHSQQHSQSRHPHDSYTPGGSQHGTPISPYGPSPQLQHDVHQSRSYDPLSGHSISPGRSGLEERMARQQRSSIGSGHQVLVGGLWPTNMIEQSHFSHSPTDVSPVGIGSIPRHHNESLGMWNQEGAGSSTDGQQHLRRTVRNDSTATSSTRPGTGSMEGSGTTALSSSAWPLVSPLSEHVALSSGQRSGTSSRMGRPHSNSVSSPRTVGRALSGSRPHSSSLSMGGGGRPLTAASAAVYGILPVTQGSSLQFNGVGDSPPGLEHSQLPYQCRPPEHPPTPPPMHSSGGATTPQILQQEDHHSSSTSWSSNLTHSRQDSQSHYPTTLPTGYEQQQYSQHQHEQEYQQQPSYHHPQQHQPIIPSAQHQQYISHSHPTTPVVDNGSSGQMGYGYTAHHTNTPAYTQDVAAAAVIPVNLSRHSSMDTTVAPAFHYHADALEQHPSTTYSDAPRYSISSAPEVIGGNVMGSNSDGSLNLGGLGGVSESNEYSGATTTTSLPTTSSTPPQTPLTEPGYSSMSTVTMSRGDSTTSMMSMAGSEVGTSNIHVDLAHLIGSSAGDPSHHYGISSVGSGHTSSSSSGGDLVSASAAGGYMLTPSSSAHSSNHEQQYHHYPTGSVYDPSTDHLQQQQQYYHSDGSNQVLSIPVPSSGMMAQAGSWDSVKHEPAV